MAVSYGTYTITEVQEGSQIWTTTVSPEYPSYTFTVSNLIGDSNASVKVGDIIMYSYYRYTVLSVSADDTTVFAGNRQGFASTVYQLIVSPVTVIKDKNGIYSPYYITLTAKSKTGTNTMGDYRGRFRIETTTDNENWEIQYTSTLNESTVELDFSELDDIVALRCSLYASGGTNTLLDQQVISVVTDGVDGNDAYTVILTNENHTFAGNTTSALASEIECNIIAYKGTTQVAATIGTITGQPTGMTTSLLNNGTVNSAFKVSVTTAMVTKNGVLTIPITVDGKTFTKKFTYALTLDGEKGDQGDTAQWYYGESLIHTSGIATLPISQTEDVVVGAMYLNTKTGICYKCTAISGTNATWTYAGNITDGIDIGGRNLLKDSNTSTYISKNSAIAHLKNGADNVPLQSFVVNIDPIQDLHGYDYPWVAGGGINKLPPMVDGTYTGNGLTAVVKDGIATLSGTSTASGNALIIPLTEEYTVTEGYVHLCNSVANGSFAPSLEGENISATSVSLSCNPVNRVNAIPSDKIGQTWTRVRVWISSGITVSGTYAPMVCEDDTVRPYAPYENICPISGWDAIKVTRCGKNLLDDVSPNVINAYISKNSNGVPILRTNAENRTVIVQIKENTTYTYTWNQSAIAGASADDSNIILFDEYPVADVTLGYSTGGNLNSSSNKRTFDSEDHKYAAIKIANIYRSNYGETLSASMLELGSTATAYEPYNGVNVSIDLGQIVYGGTLDVLSGVLTVDGMVVDLSTFTPSVRSTGNVNKTISISLPKSYVDYPDGEFRGMACSKYAYRGYTAGVSGVSHPDEKEVGIYHYRNSSNPTTQTVYFILPKDLDLDGELVFFSTEPQTIQLTPQEIKTLIGNNNIWADTGNVTINYKTNELIGNASQIIPSSTTITISIQVDANDIIWDTSATHKRIGVSLSLSKDGGGTQYIEAWASSSDENCTGIVERFNTSFHGRIKYTYTLLGDIVLNRPANLYIQGISSGTVSVSRPKLEIGNKATDWTPAPEDVDADIEDARKVATNYLSADTTGIMVADMNDGEQTPSTATGRNVFIDNDSVDIRKGTTTLASFSGDNTKFYDPIYNKELATFGAGGAIIGANNEQRFVIEKDGIKSINDSGATVFSVNSTEGTVVTEAEVAPSGETDVWSSTSITLDTVGSGFSVDVTFYNKSMTAIIAIYYCNSNLTNVKVNSVSSSAIQTSSPNIGVMWSTYSIDLPPFTFTHGTAQTTTYTITASFVNIYGDSYDLTVVETVTYDGAITITLSSLDGECVRTSGNNEEESMFAGLWSKVVYGEIYQSSAYTKAPAMTFGTRGKNAILAPFSVTIGEDLYANNDNQLSIGRYNVSNDEFFPLAFAIGNGANDTDRSNAFNVDWDGNVENMGDLEVGKSLIVDGSADNIPNITINKKSTNTTDYIKCLDSNLDAKFRVLGSGGVITAGDVSVGGAETVNGNLYAKGRLLYNSTSTPLFKVVTRTIDNISIGVNTGAYPSVAVNESGYTPIAISSITLDKASSGGTTYGWCVVQSTNMNGQTLNFYVGNWNTSSAAKIKMVIKVLCIRTSAL